MLLLLLMLPLVVPAQEPDRLPDEAFLEFLGSFEPADEDLLDIAIEAVEQEQEENEAGTTGPAEVTRHDQF
ncbi:MAG TPA: hypothetical protein EYP40_03885 [Chromatiales bacterium]|nr:hypothetical protein [Chromatiales bacterium]